MHHPFSRPLLRHCLCYLIITESWSLNQLSKLSLWFSRKSQDPWEAGLGIVQAGAHRKDCGQSLPVSLWLHSAEVPSFMNPLPAFVAPGLPSVYLSHQSLRAIRTWKSPSKFPKSALLFCFGCILIVFVNSVIRCSLGRSLFVRGTCRVNYARVLLLVLSNKHRCMDVVKVVCWILHNANELFAPRDNFNYSPILTDYA